MTLRTQHEGRRGERTLAAADCHTLARSVTLVLALAFGPGVELEPATPPSQPSAAAATPLSAPARDKPDSASNERGEERPNAGRPSAGENAALDAGRSNAPRAAARPSEGQNARDAGRPNAPRAAGRPSAARENASRNVREDAPRSDATLGAGDSASRSAAGDNAARNVGENAPPDSGRASSGEAALRDGDPRGVPLLAADSAEPLPSRDALRLALVLHASGALRLAPAFSFAAAVGVQLKLSAYAVEARALLVPTARFDITAAIRGQLRALGGSLALCRLDDIADSFELSTCAGARLVSLTVRSTGELERASATAPWTALTAAAYLGWPRRYWLQLRVEAAISLALSRPRFVIESFGDVHRVGLLVPELGLSLAAGL
ncbi:MAG TPA: hypothetical protein VFN67_26535 [Polyangiales bacterium]|nr:hypothetical protein [Polyangiales bacterium]